MKNNIASLLFFLVLLTLLSCSGSEKSAELASDLKFDVNPLLLDEDFSDSLTGMRLKIPLGWENLSTSKSESLKSKFEVHLQQDSSIVAIYIDTLNQASLIISRKYQWDDSDLKRMYNTPDSVFNEAKQWDPIMKSDFMLNGLSVHQFLLQNKELVNFKLICGKGMGRKFQIDYVIGRATYLKQVKKVESSIGTIRIL